MFLHFPHVHFSAHCGNTGRPGRQESHMAKNTYTQYHRSSSSFVFVRIVALFALSLSGPIFSIFPVWANSPAPEISRQTLPQPSPEKSQPPLIEAGAAKIHAVIEGTGHPVVLLPAMGRGVADFTDLSARLVAAGFQVIRPEPRGIGASTGPAKGLTLHDFGNDIAAVIQSIGGGPATLVGHAFGSRIARVVATDHPELVKAVILLAAEERHPAPPDVLHAQLMSYDPSLSVEVRQRVIQKAFFATGNDPSAWQGGWYRKVTRTQMAANHGTKTEEWAAAGTAPMLLLQGAEDKISPPENARRFKQQYGARVTLVEISHAAHAMLPEQPQAIAEAIVKFLQR